MRKFSACLILFFLPLLVSVVFPARVFAQDNNYLLSSGNVINSDFIRVANTLQIDGTINGDAFLAGSIVTVNGNIDGDLFVLGGKVTVNGTVGNSIRILGGDVLVNGPVGRNVLLLCANCTVSNKATISGSLLSAAGNMELSAAKIGRGFRFFGNRLYLNSEISNEAFVVADREFLLGPLASISGSLKYTGNSQAVLESGATVAGSISYQKNNGEDSYPRFFGARTILETYKKIKPLTDFIGFVVSAIIGFILLGLFPKGFEKSVRAIENRPYASLGWGIIMLLMVPTIALLFAITIVGIPVSIVLLIVFYLVWICSQYLMAFFIGRKILLPRFGERRGWALILGLFLIYLVGLIPVVGMAVKIVLVLFAVGALVLAYRERPIFEQKPLPFSWEPEKTDISEKKRRGRPKKA